MFVQPAMRHSIGVAAISGLRCISCLLLLAAPSFSEGTGDGPWNLWWQTRCLKSRGATPPNMVLGRKKCSKWFGADARGGRVLFRMHEQEPAEKYVVHWNEDTNKWTVAKEDSDQWEKRQLFEMGAEAGTWCLVYDETKCLQISSDGDVPKFTTTTGAPTTTTKATTTKPAPKETTAPEKPGAPKPTKPPAPKKPCPKECQSPICKDGSDTNGGVNMKNGKCGKFASQMYGENRYCGDGPAYRTEGHYDCGMCDEDPEPICTKDCKSPICKAGTSDNGGETLSDGKCMKYCSRVFGENRYCGEGPAYIGEGHVDCTGCAIKTAPGTKSPPETKAPPETAPPPMSDNDDDEPPDTTTTAEPAPSKGRRRRGGKGKGGKGSGGPPHTRRRRRAGRRRRKGVVWSPSSAPPAKEALL